MGTTYVTAQAGSAAGNIVCNKPVNVFAHDATLPEAPPGKWQKLADPSPSTAATSSSSISTVVDPYKDMPTLSSDDTTSKSSFTAPWRKSAGGTGLPAAKPKVTQGSTSTPWNKLTSQPTSTSSTATGTILILFSGPKSNPANLQHSLRKLGLEVDAYDLVDGADLADDAIWIPIKNRLEGGYYSAVFASPPCNSFSRLRGSDTTGP